MRMNTHVTKTVSPDTSTLARIREVTNTEIRNAGIPTVAVYSEADRHAAHVRMAQQAFCIGAPPAKESYLRKDRVLEV